LGSSVFIIVRELNSDRLREIVYYNHVRSYLLVLVLLSLGGSTACYHGTKPSDVGRQAPEFTVHDTDHTVSLDQFRGKTIVLNFWASWCPPCVEELPSLMQLQKELQDKGVVVLGISVDSEAGDYEKFLKDHDVNFLTVRDPGEQNQTGVVAAVSAKYGTFRFPETYIIDRNGVIRRKLIGPVNFTQPEIVEFLSRL
jgi:cytochrome c biogenesis protein CcmG/thiol:disulfide interchange protein DsbE